MESPTWRLYFEIAYVLRRRVTEVMSWPLAEVMMWQSLFDVVGPLDWSREDWRDARRHAFEYGKVGDTIADHRMFTPAQKAKTELDEHIESLESMLPLAAQMGTKENLEQLRNKIRMAKQQRLRMKRER